MPAPDRYAVIGHPIAHSRSPQIHGLFALQTRQHMRYDAFDVAPEQLSSQVHEFFASGGGGLNVTVPHKQAVAALCDHLAPRARTAGAVNTLWRDAEQRLVGDNTDGIGLVRDLTQNLGVSVAGRRVLLLGAGGAARGVLAPLLALQPQELLIANRSAARALALAGEFAASGPVRGVGFDELEGLRVELIINATAAGLQRQLPPLPASALASGPICYDLAYGARETAFASWTRAHGARQSHTGLGMLVEQAAESFFLWRGVRPETNSVLAAIADEPQRTP
jgi:shikimate dehydrogenase